MADQVLPILPPPPRLPAEGITVDYANQLNRWLENLARQLGGISYLRGSGLYLAPESFPTTGYSLKPGEVFANDGILTWVREGEIWLGPLSVTGSVGSVTVSV